MKQARVNRKRRASRPKPSGDITKPHLRQFLECKKIGEEPPLNTQGFWQKRSSALVEAGKALTSDRELSSG